MLLVLGGLLGLAFGLLFPLHLQLFFQHLAAEDVPETRFPRKAGFIAGELHGGANNPARTRWQRSGKIEAADRRAGAPPPREAVAPRTTTTHQQPPVSAVSAFFFDS